MIGLSHITRDFVMLKVPLELIEEHQNLFPELKDKMIGPDTTKIYLAFLTMLPYQVKGELTEDKKKEILKQVGLIK